MVANLRAQKKIFHHRIVNSRNNESLDKAVASFEEAYEKVEQEDRTREEDACESYTDAVWESITSAEDTLGELAEKEIELSNSSDNPGQVEEMRLRLQKACRYPRSFIGRIHLELISVNHTYSSPNALTTSSATEIWWEASRIGFLLGDIQGRI
ncbi:hypothetical protein GCK32_006830 [Trichostrongylus colubriformis]|uniref:Uncharacterized protein n=1 Tax=Trichostrongylus colubriformis TaxID=6319 RepID=A0AAN8G401_TRICO